MSRETYVWCPVAKAVVEKWRAAPRERYDPAPAIPRPHVIGPMPETQHICDGRVYTSRERYEAVTRAHGAVEIGRTEGLAMLRRGPTPVEVGPTVKESVIEALKREE